MATTDETEHQPVARGDIDERNAEIARRAYEISLGDDAGTPEENWWRAAAEVDRSRRAGG